jgi:drug/metabolite transporter (DMT)-like permease
LGAEFAPLLAVLSSICFGLGLISGRIGLRSLDSRAGAAVSIPTATVLFLLAAPFALDTTGWRLDAVIGFAVVGVFFPAIVTLLTFRSNELAGPTLTSAVAGTAPLFALLAAALVLHEDIPGRAALSALGVVVGILLLTWKPGEAMRVSGRGLSWALAGAVLRGAAQVGAKAALLLWPNPFAASLVGYIVSSSTVLVANHGRPRPQGSARAGVPWFMLTGVLNGSSVIFMYLALAKAPVWIVAPIVTSYPVVTAIAGALLLREERFSWRRMLGASITVAAIAWLVAR